MVIPKPGLTYVTLERTKWKVKAHVSAFSFSDRFNSSSFAKVKITSL